MIQNEREIRHAHVLQAVRQMMMAARTAPKGKGIDIIEVAMVTDEDINRLSEKMVSISEETGLKFFLRCWRRCILLLSLSLFIRANPLTVPPGSCR